MILFCDLQIRMMSDTLRFQLYDLILCALSILKILEFNGCQNVYMTEPSPNPKHPSSPRKAKKEYTVSPLPQCFSMCMSRNIRS